MKKILFLLSLILFVFLPIAVFAAVVNNADTAANWVSSDTTNTVVSQETTIKHEGTGSVKVQTVAETATSTVDLMEYSSDATTQAAYVSNSLCSTGSGGTETTDGAYRIHTFTGSGTFTISGTSTVDYLIVGGGGSAGTGWSYGQAFQCGGAGGGQVLQGSSAPSPGSYTVTVGGSDQDSSFNSVTANKGNQPPRAGNDTNGGTSGSGRTGGISETNVGGGGGAGDSANGGYCNDGYGGIGGAGTSSTITGSAVYYGGGGGGAGYNSGASGGTGGGGTGGNRFGPATNGTANTGGGGGGGSISGYLGTKYSGGSGGSGVVIVKYLDLTLQSFSESAIKTQGSYSLKGIAKATTSLNKTLTRTVSPTLDLSNKTSVTFDMRALRTGSNIKIGLHDSGGTTTEVTPNITSANAFQSVSIDLSGVSNANKDVINQIIVTVVNADADNTFYIDNMVDTGKSLNDTVTLTTASTDLSGSSSISFWVYSSVVGSFARFQFGETASSEQISPISIISANTWEQKSFNISNIPAGDRNAVTKFAFQFTSDTSGAAYYFDDINSNTYIGCPSVPNGGNYTVYDAGCAFSGEINGVDAGTGTDNSAILQVGQTVGEGGATGDLTILGTQTIAVGEINLVNGSITIIDGGQIKLDTPLYLPDADTDSYPTAVTTTQYISAATGRARRNIASDCNDTGTNAANVHISATCYADTDNDNYGTGTAKTCTNNAACSSATWASGADGTAAAASDLADNATDCNDSDINKWQNLTAYTDADSDSYGTGTSSLICTGSSLPAGYAANNADCNDGSNLVFSSTTCYKDLDGDNYTLNTVNCTNNAACTSATYGAVGTATPTSFTVGTLLATSGSGTDANDTQTCAAGANPTGACNKCVSGAISNQNGTDDFSECDAVQCNSGNCNGAGACAPLAAGESGQPVCGRCNGSSLSTIAITYHTKDTEGNNVCGTHYGCTAIGSCDWITHCSVCYNETCDTYCDRMGTCTGGSIKNWCYPLP